MTRGLWGLRRHREDEKSGDSEGPAKLRSRTRSRSFASSVPGADVGRESGQPVASCVRMMAWAISFIDLRVFMDIFWMRRKAAASVMP